MRSEVWIYPEAAARPAGLGGYALSERMEELSELVCALWSRALVSVRIALSARFDMQRPGAESYRVGALRTGPSGCTRRLIHSARSSGWPVRLALLRTRRRYSLGKGSCSLRERLCPPCSRAPRPAQQRRTVVMQIFFANLRHRPENTDRWTRISYKRYYYQHASRSSYYTRIPIKNKNLFELFMEQKNSTLRPVITQMRDNCSYDRDFSQQKLYFQQKISFFNYKKYREN